MNVEREIKEIARLKTIAAREQALLKYTVHVLGIMINKFAVDRAKQQAQRDLMRALFPPSVLGNRRTPEVNSLCIAAEAWLSNYWRKEEPADGQDAYPTENNLPSEEREGNKL